MKKLGLRELVSGIMRIKELLKKEQEFNQLSKDVKKLNVLFKPQAGTPTSCVEDYYETNKQ